MKKVVLALLVLGCRREQENLQLTIYTELGMYYLAGNELSEENEENVLRFKSCQEAANALEDISVRDMLIAEVLPKDHVLKDHLQLGDTLPLQRFLRRAGIGQTAILEDHGYLIYQDEKGRYEYREGR